MALKFIGTLREPRGLKGEIEIRDVPECILEIADSAELHIGFTESFSEVFQLEKWGKAHHKIIISLKGIKTPESASELNGKGVFTDEKNIFYDDESYFIDDLLRCSVYNHKNGEIIGEIADVLLLPANDVWIVKTLEGELPLPVIKDVIKKVDIKNRRVEIDLIDGLLELTDKKNEEDNFTESDEN